EAEQRQTKRLAAAIAKAVLVGIDPAGGFEQRRDVLALRLERRDRRLDAVDEPTRPDRPERRPGKPANAALGDLPAIDEQRDRVAHAWIVERRARRVERDEPQPRRCELER